jgi:hypothetical protein
MSKTKDLGIATAYGYAVSKGYTGTEEEFALLMASYATVAEEALDSAENSEAYAVGKRSGGDVAKTDPTYQNNSKWYAERAKESADEAYDRVAAAGYMHFQIDENGHLEYIKNNAVDADFSIDSNGHLVVGGLR